MPAKIHRRPIFLTDVFPGYRGLIGDKHFTEYCNTINLAKCYWKINRKYVNES